jgi:hypothetical protein
MVCVFLCPLTFNLSWRASQPQYTVSRLLTPHTLHIAHSTTCLTRVSTPRAECARDEVAGFKHVCSLCAHVCVAARYTISQCAPAAPQHSRRRQSWEAAQMHNTNTKHDVTHKALRQHHTHVPSIDDTQVDVSMTHLCNAALHRHHMPARSFGRHSHLKHTHKKQLDKTF